MKVKVDSSTCTGCGVCSDTCPSVFELGDDMISKVKVDEVPEDCKEKVRESAENCPVTCIEISE